jgi:hypothetical protein
MPEFWLNRLIEAEQVNRQASNLSYQLKAVWLLIGKNY